MVLASASPQRRKLLKELRVPFRIVPSEVSEGSRERDPRRLVILLALRKARAVARRHPQALVLGADTVVVHAGRVLGKPAGRPASAEMLKTLNGRWHRVYTGVALVHHARRRSWSEAAVSRVKARRLADAQLFRFVGRHLDKAGGYAIQDARDPFIERIEGARDNVIGLPMETVRRLFKRACADAR
ncbi:MAG: septum formation protein Maf [Elusimicrobia bacterium]|nr:septum formation protein Maf [Elusimicrobiota bacterium]